METERKEMKRPPPAASRSPPPPSQPSRSASGGGAAAYAVASDTATETVVRQVTVTNSSLPPRSAAERERPYDRVHRGRGHDQGEHPAAGAKLSAPASSSTAPATSSRTTTSSTAQARSRSNSADGSTYEAHLVGADASTDVAVIKVDAPSSELIPLQFGDSSASRSATASSRSAARSGSTRPSRAAS